MEATKELVGELLIDLKGVPTRKYDLEKLALVLGKLKYMSSLRIRNDIVVFLVIYKDLKSWMALPCLEAVATRPMFRRTSSWDRAQTWTRCLFLRYPRWGPDLGCT